MRPGTTTTAGLAVLAAIGLFAGPASAGPHSTDQPTAAPTVTGPITGGRVGIPFTSSPVPLGPAGYTEQEYFLSGTATGYQEAGTWDSDGRWSVTPAEQAAYETRILVRRPADPARFNGTVVVEWLNVSSDVDLDADYLYDNAELLREGYAWVGVSAQALGVDALKAIDPTRYGGLNHPGDTFSYDIFSQAARSLLSPAGVAPLGGLRPKALIGDGESQSAFRMTTYANAIQPVDHLFNGFLIHSRSADASPISQAPQIDQPSPPIAEDRTDLDVPVLDVQTETDLFIPPLFYQQLNQPDSTRFRLWELAGSSHVDAAWLDLAKTEVSRFVPPPPPPCALPANSDDENYLMDNALAQLNRWVRVGVPPVTAPRIEVDGSTIVRDADGNALGGVRSPIVQAPTASHSGVGNSGDALECQLNGTMTPFTAAQLSARYPTHAAYVAAVSVAALGDVARGYLLPVDAAEIIKSAGSAPIPA
ncbi:MAG TPA: alpha/beta hydrolase domain-containing protein [Pseudonocardiaceae bacterium]|nr:alpha/beta hydrolase domain-containing protein [Pseudonocardiaceae bacterium]